MQLSDARVLVTGGGTGIGLAIAERLAKGGAKVAVCGRREDVLTAAAARFGGLAVCADVSREADVEALVARVIEEFGDVNVLVNNAAIGSFGPLLETDPGTFADVLSVNVIGAMLVARGCARHFVARPGGGTIVNIGSTAATKGFANGTAYAASKFALTAMTECWRAELRQHDVRVMQVNPSEVITQFGRSGGEPRPDNPTKLHADDVAHLVESLVTLDDRGFVTDLTLWATNPR